MCALALLLALPLTAAAENWPGFRGPTGQGHSTETGLPQQWSPTNHVAWKTATPGQGWSSPIVWGGRVFVTTTKENGTKCHVLCLDAGGGKILWDKPVFEQVPLRKEGKNSYATPTPTTDGERIYAAFGDGSIAAVTFDGSVVWTNREVPFYSRHGLGASPLLHGGLLIQTYDGSQRVKEAGQYPNNSPDEKTGWLIPWEQALIVALDVKTGRRVWTGRRGKSRIAHASPIVLREGGQEQLLSIAGDVVQGFDFKTGERLWSVHCQGESPVPSPVTGDGLIFAGSGFEKPTVRGIRAGGQGDATATPIAWEQRKGVPNQASLLYAKPHLYAVTDGGVVTCYQGGTGNILWQERVGGTFSPSPLLAGGKIYFLNEAGETTVLAVGSEFKIVSKNSLGEKTQASMAASDGRLFIRTEKNLFCIAAPLEK